MITRTLITGLRRGNRVVIQEVERPTASRRYCVIVFCFDCRKAVRMEKGNFVKAPRCACLVINQASRYKKIIPRRNYQRFAGYDRKSAER